MKNITTKQAAFLRKYSAPLILFGRVIRYYFYSRDGRIEVKGIRFNNSIRFYFIYKGVVKTASNLVSLKKAALNMGISCFHTYSFVK